MRVGKRTKDSFVKPHTQEAREAFTMLVRKHQKAVFAVAFGKLRNAHDAEDVTQDVFIEAYRNYHKIKKPEKISAWLFTATKHRCTDHIRKNARRERRERVFAASANPSSDGHIEEERRQDIAKAIDSLPEKFRVLVLLKHFARLSYDDISHMTGVSKTTIDGRLRTAKKRLSEKLIEMGIEVS